MNGQLVDDQPKHTVSAYEGDRLVVEEYFEDPARAASFARAMVPIKAVGIDILLDGKKVKGEK